jgi:hypothetical protein
MIFIAMNLKGRCQVHLQTHIHFHCLFHLKTQVVLLDSFQQPYHWTKFLKLIYLKLRQIFIAIQKLMRLLQRLNAKLPKKTWLKKIQGSHNFIGHVGFFSPLSTILFHKPCIVCACFLH